MPTVKSRNTAFKIITIASIALGGYFIISKILATLTYLNIISVMGILELFASLTLVSAGLSALLSIKIGFYVYVAACMFWLLRFLPMIFFEPTIFAKIPQPLAYIITIVFGLAAIPFWLSLLGVIICYYELKTHREKALNQETTNMRSDYLVIMII